MLNLRHCRVDTSERISEAFKYKHPFRIDLEDGYHVRFSDIWTASRSAVWHRAPIFDEIRDEVIPFEECWKFASRAISEVCQ